MVKTTLKQWVWSGIDSKSYNNINPIRLTNIVALLVITVSTLQIPTIVYFWQSSHPYELIIVICTISCLLFVPLLNARRFHHLAKSTLIMVYIADIFLSCLLWKVNLNIQYFFLLAVFICPFFFNEDELLSMGLVLLSLIALFLGFEGWFQISPTIHYHNLHQRMFKLSCASLFALSCLLCSFHLWKNVNKSWRKLYNERKRSEQLLLNVLPPSIAQRLKSSPTFIADHYKQASILFADIQNFTPLCKNLSPQQLIQVLNEVFCAFDNLSMKYGLEKIKTNGDGYMAASGLPAFNSKHAIQCCYCALDMQSEFRQISRRYKLNTGLRIGIGCGEVIAGIIGKNKFSYDTWGEAVNLASRMETQGLSNRVQVTETVYKLAKFDFLFQQRGTIKVKGIGDTKTYWLLSRKARI